MLILGINEGIESSVVFCRDGEVLFAVQEERLSRESGHIGFPYQSVSHCLKAYQLDRQNIDHVCWSNLNSPRSETRDGIMQYYAHRARSWPELWLSGDVAAALIRFGGRLPTSIGDVLADWQFSRRKARSNPSVERLLARCGLDGMKTHRFHHHLNHAASAYYGLRRNVTDPHLIFTLDGGGDDACAHVYLARAGRLELLAATAAGHSLGNVYACTTFLMGMRPHEHEYKLMGLAPYAYSSRAEMIRQKLQHYLDLDPANPLRFKRKVRERTTMLLPRMAHDLRFTRFDDVAAAIYRGPACPVDRLLRQTDRRCERPGGGRSIHERQGEQANR
jgi:carbamoyltransferase